jgi:hypothetical protein
MSKILKMKLDWMEGWGNSPRLKVLFNELPCERYEERNGLYLSIDGDAAHYIYWNGDGNTGGYGGREIEVTMKDGSVRKLLGPWSSRAECVSKEFPETPIIEASCTADESTFIKGYTFYSGAVTIESLKGKTITLIKGDDSELLQEQAYLALLSDGSYEFVIQDSFGPEPRWLTKDRWMSMKQPGGWKDLDKLPEVAVVFRGE